MTRSLNLKYFQQLREDLGRAGDDGAAVHVGVFAVNAGDEAAGFQDQQRAGRHVPLVQFHLPETIVEAGRDVRQIERRRARTAQAGRLGHQVLELGDVVVERGAVTEREAGADQGVAQLGGLRDTNPAVVHEGAGAAGGGEKIVAVRVVNHRLRELALDLQRDGHAVGRHTVQEIGGAIERIDDPDVIALRVAARGAGSLLGDDAVARVGAEQRIYNRRFRVAVDFADEIARPLAVDGQPVEVTGAVLNDFGGFAGGLDRRIEHRVHGKRLKMERT